MQAGRLQRELPVVVVDVEQAALRAGLGRGLGLVDRRRDAVDVQDAGEREAAEAGADDRDGCRHGDSFRAHGTLFHEPAWNTVPDAVKMAPWQRRRDAQRRTDALSRERIVDAAVEMLDAAGESGLTFRALAAAAAPPGRRDLLARGEQERAARRRHRRRHRRVLTGAARAGRRAAGRDPRRRARRVRRDRRPPWVGTQLDRLPCPAATLRIFERIGRQVQALGVPDAGSSRRRRRC